jgi:hypothetical protein
VTDPLRILDWPVGSNWPCQVLIGSVPVDFIYRDKERERDTHTHTHIEREREREKYTHRESEHDINQSEDLKMI